MMTEFSQVEAVEQIGTFGYGLLLGVALCLFYDLFRLFRAVFPVGNLVLFVQDLLYFSLSAVAVFCFLMIRCEGILRLYVLLAAGLGGIACRFTLSRWCFRPVLKILLIIKGAAKRILRLFLVDFQHILRFFTRLFDKQKNILKRKKKPLENGTPLDV